MNNAIKTGPGGPGGGTGMWSYRAEGWWADDWRIVWGTGRFFGGGYEVVPDAERAGLVARFLACYGRPETRRAYRRHMARYPWDVADRDGAEQALSGLTESNRRVASTCWRAFALWAAEELARNLVRPEKRYEPARMATVERLLERRTVDAMRAVAGFPGEVVEVLYRTAWRVGELASAHNFTFSGCRIERKGGAIERAELGPDLAARVARVGGRSVAIYRRAVAAAGASAGLVGRVSPHWLRHAAASHVYGDTGSVEAVRRLLGHRSGNLWRRYVHPSPGIGVYRTDCGAVLHSEGETRAIEALEGQK